MRAVVLGSAAGGGFPQWNCGCANCRLAWARDPRAVWRTQSSLAFVGPDGCVLVNASPDIGQQLRATPDLWPRSERNSPISTVVLTSAEIDHVAGLLSLRERHALDILALAPVRAAIRDNPMLQPLSANWVAAEAEMPIPAHAGFELTLFPVPGKAPLYLEADEPITDSETGETSGLAMEGPNASLVYIPGCAVLNQAVRQRAERAHIVLFDGTLFDDEEMRRGGLGPKTGRRMGHMPMTGPGGSLDWLAELPASRKIYTHINNTNPVLIEGSRERRLVESAGVEIAHDGLEISL
ncbi:pyrroloquinoline quinone biosynthesis protein PqqB [Bosea sp. 124]|uniref:pyrroloquinoline quinone biosynthesis protein PqqB n=1 Tax=Bosea sp. 124 TaxID=2135642 RepID=UPI000D3B5633|nr:pyrroloquinoline quinone biosynthesis protein PqqB [Bosea sp. 124]PTM39593.1 pyrroloquinoline quinone biosynthesis protein B [Bosea sp. 124]